MPNLCSSTYRQLRVRSQSVRYLFGTMHSLCGRMRETRRRNNAKMCSSVPSMCGYVRRGRTRGANSAGASNKEFLGDYVEHKLEDRRSFLHYLGLLAFCGGIFGIRAWPVVGFVIRARTSIPRCMEPPVLFDHCHFRRRDIELEEQRLGFIGSTLLLSASRTPALSSSSLFPDTRPFGLAFWARYFGCWRRFFPQSLY